MKKGRIAIGLILFSCSFFLLGYFRTYVFLNINERASLIYFKEQYPPFPGFLGAFEAYSYAQLNNLKWVLTFLFTITFASVSAFAIYVAFKQKALTYLTLGLYGFVFLISLLFMAIGLAYSPFYTHGFNISRSLIHFEQTPMIAIVLFLSIYYYKKDTHT